MRRLHPKRTAFIASAVCAVATILATVACGTEPVGVESCRKIEKVRCESAAACGIDLTRPVHVGEGPKADVAACIRYYDEQCLHGLVAPVDPGPQAVDACVDAIIHGDCGVVRSPEMDPACSFLVPPPEPAPPPPAPDAGVVGDAAAPPPA